jgi:superfamily II DNA helicase RecQ
LFQKFWQDKCIRTEERRTLVEFLDSSEKNSGETIKSKVDYKDILTPEEFTLFSKLREVRKKLAEENGLPVYAVCTNEQLARNSKA